MARTFDITNSRAAGFALLKPADKPQLDAARIATLSGTIAVNVPADAPRLDEADLVLSSLDDLVIERQADGYVNVRLKA